MVTLFKAEMPTSSQDGGYTKKQEIDTRIPPKAKPVFNEVSVNGVAIAESDILNEAQNHPAQNPGDALAQAARALVVHELLWQQAQKLGLSNIAAQDSATQLPIDQAIDRLLDAEIDTPAANDDDCLRFYQNNSDRFSSETIFEVRHILIKADPQNTKARHDAKSIATHLITILAKNPARFAELALEHSACPSAQHGGNLGQITRGSTVAEFEHILQRVEKAGLLPAPIETRYGFHVVDVTHIVKGTLMPFDMVKERIAAWLEASSWSRAVAQYIGILAAKAEITGIQVLPTQGDLVQ